MKSSQLVTATAIAAAVAYGAHLQAQRPGEGGGDRKSTRLNSSHANISYAVFCLKKKDAQRSCIYVRDPTSGDRTRAAPDTKLYPDDGACRIRDSRSPASAVTARSSPSW